MTDANDGPPRAIIGLVVAADEAGGIGKDGGLPWHLPNDLKFFKRVTSGHPVVMGRKTHQSIGKALPGRANVVVSRDPDYRPAEGCVSAPAIDTALAMARRMEGGETIMVIGGAEVFRAVLPRADRIYLTRVHATFPADTFLPDIDETEWREAWREDQPADERNAYRHTFVLLERRRSGGEGSRTGHDVGEPGETA